MSRSDYSSSLGDEDFSEVDISDDDLVDIDQDDISNYNPENILPESAGNIRKIQKWLKPTKYDIAGSEYRKHLESHVDGTGSWLTSSDPYQEWLRSQDHGLLWMKGIPGSGKSVHTAKAIQSLNHAYPDCPVLFFFFRQIIAANHEPQALVRDWMDQLLPYSPPLQRRLMKYVKERASLSNLSTAKLLQDLKQAFLSLPKRVYCVVDALDEMDGGNEAFIQELASLGLWRPSIVKVFITSRPVPQIELPLRKFPALLIRLEETLVDNDIRRYVKKALAGSTIPKEQWQTVTNAVPGKANGLFLYARLAMDAFLQPGADVNKVLRELPEDLNMVYSGLLEAHRLRSGVSESVQLLILQTMTHSIRPLRLLELAELIRVLEPDGQSTDLGAAKDLVRQACGPLLEILPDETISVIHHSFTEYLIGSTRSKDQSGYPILRSGNTHDKLARACLQYLLASGCLERQATVPPDDSEDEEPYGGNRHSHSGTFTLLGLYMKFPFLEYAATNWHAHVRAAEVAAHKQDETIKLLHEFFKHKRAFGYSIDMMLIHRISEAKDLSSLHFAAALGLVAYTRTLVQDPDLKVDGCDEHGRTPLWWAASEGHSSTVKVLVEAGADPNCDEHEYGWRPLHVAAQANYADVLKVLLDAGVNPETGKTREDPGRRCGNARQSTGDTAMRCACLGGHIEAVDVLLPVVSLEEAQYALGWAVEGKHPKLVQRIAQHPGIDVDVLYGTSTLLYKACKNHDLLSVEALLRAGADPDRCRQPYDRSREEARIGWSGDRYRHATVGATPLFALFGGKYAGEKIDKTSVKSIFRCLLKAGINVHHRSSDGRTALHEAAKGPASLAKLLLDAGVSADAACSAGNTPLHDCTSASMVSLLVEQGGASIDAVNSDGQTPLSLALQEIVEDKALELLRLGADVSMVKAKDKAVEKGGPLHLLLNDVRSRHESHTIKLIQELLKRGANPDQRDLQGQTVLMLPRARGEDIQGLLLKAGAGLDARDFSGKTLFFRTASDTNVHRIPDDTIPILQRLVHLGATPTTRDFKGKTCLHEVVGLLGNRQRLKRVECAAWKRWDMLIEMGLDPKDVDYEGNSLLHTVAQRETKGNAVPVLKYLVDSTGLDVNQVNHLGRTALHTLCEIDHAGGYRSHRDRSDCPITFLLERSDNIDTRDYGGVTALHLAAARNEFLVKRLLEAGADPFATTHEKMNALHIAARAQRINIVGLLLAAIHRRGGGAIQDVPNTKASSNGSPGGLSTEEKTNLKGVEDINSRDANDKTPLYYAVRSGRPETVALLLEAGANPDQGQAGCLDFEAEYSFVHNPSLSQSDHHKDHDIRLDTYSRMQIRPMKDLENDTARLEEILTMLVAHGAKVTALPYNLRKLRGGSVIIDPRKTYNANGSALVHSGYTAYCLSLHMSDADVEMVRTVMAVNGVDIASTWHPVLGRDPSFPSVTNEQNQRQAFVAFMRNRKYLHVEELARRGADFLLEHKPDRTSNFRSLVHHGFTRLVESVGELIAQKSLETRHMHAFGDSTQPGLWYAQREGGTDGLETERPNIPEPFLVAAVKRAEPNIAMMQLLVEKFKVDPNEPHMVDAYGSSKHIAGETALHHAAYSWNWWHVHQALPYLLSLPGIEINPRITSTDITPLHLAVSTGKNLPRGESGMYNYDAARILIEHGADLDAVAFLQGRKYTCFDLARGDAEMMKLLIRHGAKVTPETVMSAAQDANIDVLEALLSAGLDPNIMQSTTADFMDSGIRKSMIVSQNVALHAAMGEKGGSWRGRPERESCPIRQKIIRLLLKHGANPLVKIIQDTHGQSLPWNYLSKGKARPTIQVPVDRREATVLHEFVFRTDCEYLPILMEAGIDLNARDAYGLTVLHALFLVGRDINKSWSEVTALENEDGDPMDIDSEREVNTRSESLDRISGTQKESVLEHLISAGADIMARDYSERNILMALFGSDIMVSTPEDRERAISAVLAVAPELLDQKDLFGETPLMYALRIGVVYIKIWSKPVSRLLEAGASINCKNKKGDGLLHIMAGNLTPEHQPLFQELVHRGLDINGRNAAGRTPLFAFAQRQAHNSWTDDRWEVKRAAEIEKGATELFRTLGADFSVKDKNGCGLLHVAAEGDDTRFRELMEQGLDPLDEDDSHQTAVDKAAIRSNTSVLKIFEKPKI